MHRIRRDLVVKPGKTSRLIFTDAELQNVPKSTRNKVLRKMATNLSPIKICTIIKREVYITDEYIYIHCYEYIYIYVLT